LSRMDQVGTLQAMYVRWQFRDHASPGWRAILVESVRSNGAPRQRHIAYLGSIYSEHIERLGARVAFWDRVLAALDKLHNRLSEADRAQIVAAVARKVEGPPTPEQREQAEQQREQARREHEELISRINTAFAEADHAHVRCGFCGKGADDVRVMVTGGPHVAICNECIAGCAEVVKEQIGQETERAPAT